MIKIQYASDLHLEFPENMEYLSLNPLQPSGDILLLAGDVVLFKYLDKFKYYFKMLSEQYAQVLWIPGNHEYYHGDILSTEFSFEEEVFPNVRLLNNKTVTFQDVNFICSTLWTNVPDAFKRPVSYGMNDFRNIHYGQELYTVDDYNQLHDKSIQFIVSELERLKGQRCVVVTHHVPTFLHYPEDYKGNALNYAFASEYKDTIIQYQPAAWIFGHNHYPADFTIGDCKMLANPLGYIMCEEEEFFKADAVVSC